MPAEPRAHQTAGGTHLQDNHGGVLHIAAHIAGQVVPERDLLHLARHAAALHGGHGSHCTGGAAGGAREWSVQRRQRRRRRRARRRRGGVQHPAGGDHGQLARRRGHPQRAQRRGEARLCAHVSGALLLQELRVRAAEVLARWAASMIGRAQIRAQLQPLDCMGIQAGKGRHSGDVSTVQCVTKQPTRV